AALVAHAVLVGDRALADIGDDFHVRMRMRRKAGARLDGVVVPHPQRAPVDARRIVVLGEGEMMPGVEPAVVGSTEACEGATLDHVGSPEWMLGWEPGRGPCSNASRLRQPAPSRATNSRSATSRSNAPRVRKLLGTVASHDAVNTAASARTPSTAAVLRTARPANSSTAPVQASNGTASTRPGVAAGAASTSTSGPNTSSRKTAEKRKTSGRTSWPGASVQPA